MDLKNKCLSHIGVLEYLRKYLDAPAREALTPKRVRFVLIMDMCRVPGPFASTDKIEPDRNKAPGCWSICYSTSQGCVAEDDQQGSHSPLALGLLDPQSGIFAPGVSLKHGIENACQRVQKLSGADTRQLPINIALDALGDFILHPATSDNRPSVNDAVTVSTRERPQKVSEGAGMSADTPTSQHEIVAYLKRRGLYRMAERVSDELGLEEIDGLKALFVQNGLGEVCADVCSGLGAECLDDLKLVTAQDLSDLPKYVKEKLTPVQKRKLAAMIEGQRTVAGGATDSTNAATSREARAADTATAAHASLPRIEGFFCKINPNKEGPFFLEQLCELLRLFVRSSQWTRTKRRSNSQSCSKGAIVVEYLKCFFIRSPHFKSFQTACELLQSAMYATSLFLGMVNLGGASFGSKKAHLSMRESRQRNS
jgi:hypothetical protein